MNMRELTFIIKKFRDKKIVVIGDLMLDHYIYGDVDRISPEAPVPTVAILNEKFLIGGAGNVAHNITSLGASASLVGLIGKDSAGSRLLTEYKNKKIDTSGILQLADHQTIQKMRVIARGQHMLRIDKEKREYINKETEDSIFSFVKNNIKLWDILVISDYAKGLLTRKLITKIINLSKKNNKIIIADTKPKHGLYYKGITLLKLNNKEAQQLSGFPDARLAGKKIQKLLHCNILITQGENGMTFIYNNNIRHFATKAKEVYDISGAGDTVLAVLALTLACKSSFEEAITIANYAAGIVVGKLGTATLTQAELKLKIENNE